MWMQEPRSHSWLFYFTHCVVLGKLPNLCEPQLLPW